MPQLKTLNITPFCESEQQLTNMLTKIFYNVENLGLLYSTTNVNGGDFAKLGKNGSKKPLKSLKISFLKLNLGHFLVADLDVSENLELYCWAKNAAPQNPSNLFGPPNKFTMTKMRRSLVSCPLDLDLGKFLQRSAFTPFQALKFFDVNFKFVENQLPNFYKFLASAKTLEFHKIDWLDDMKLKVILSQRKSFFKKSTITTDQKFSVLVKLCPNIQGRFWSTKRFLSKATIEDFQSRPVDEIRFEYCHNVDHRAMPARVLREMKRNPHLLVYKEQQQ